MEFTDGIPQKIPDFSHIKFSQLPVNTNLSLQDSLGVVERTLLGIYKMSLLPSESFFLHCCEKIKRVHFPRL